MKKCLNQPELQHTQGVHVLKGSAYTYTLKWGGKVGKDVDGAAGHLCRFQTEMKISAPLPIGYPAGSPFSGGGSTSSASDLLIKIGGWGYIRRDSARAARTYGSLLMSSRSVWTPACQYLLVTNWQANEYRKEAMGLVMEECFKKACTIFYTA